MTTPESAPVPPRRRKRFWRIVRWSLLILLLLAGSLLAFRQYRVHTAEQRLAEVIAELDRTDPGWRFEDIFLNRPSIPDEENGALVIAEMMLEMPQDWPPTEGHPPAD